MDRIPVRLTALFIPLLMTFYGCAGVEPGERDAVLAWLSCETCQNGERAAVASLGSDATTLLMEPLDTSSRGGRRLRRALEQSARASYLSLPTAAMDSAAYLRFFVDNALARAQTRAAASLGDVRATDEILEAIAEQGQRGLRPRVVQALQSALVQATSGLAPAADSVVLAPVGVELELGQSVTFSAVVLDEFGTEVPGAAVGWTMAGLAVASVNGEGTVTTSGLGADTVLAVHAPTGDTARAVVRVVVPTPLPSLALVGGARQTGVAGSPLDSLLVVRLEYQGNPAAGVPVAWAVASGGGTLSDVDYKTRADGTARARWSLGPPAGDQRIRVVGPRNVPVQIRATALPYPGPLAVSGVVVVDGLGSGGVEVTTSAGDSAVSESAGRFFLPFPGPGTYDVTARFSASPFPGPDVTKQVAVSADAPLAVASFQASVDPGAVVGSLFRDDAPRDNVFDSGIESRLMIAGVAVYVDRPDGGTNATTTNANGEFALTGLAAGTYTVRLDPAALSGLPNVTFGGTSPAVLISVAPGEVTTVNFPFDPS